MNVDEIEHLCYIQERIDGIKKFLKHVLAGPDVDVKHDVILRLDDELEDLKAERAAIIRNLAEEGAQEMQRTGRRRSEHD